MSRALTIEKSTGKLRLLEADVDRQVTDFLEWNGWVCTRTAVIKALSTQGFIDIGEKGHADRLCTRPVAEALCGCFFLETKRHRGKFSAKHIAQQKAWQAGMEARGYLVCVLPMDVPDLYTWFREWYHVHFGDSKI